MKSSLIFIFLFLLVFTPFVSAQPFVETAQFAQGFAVEFTPLGVYPNGEDIQINAHIFNISNGREIDNTTANCRFSLFEGDGEHVINSVNMTYVDVPLGSGDWEFLILGSNFTDNSDHSYLIDCQDATNSLGGFVAVEFTITEDGMVSVPFPQQFSIIALGLILIIFGLFNNRYRLMQHLGSIIIMVMGVLTIFPGYNNISHSSLFGLSLGTILIAMGFYFLVEDSFSREGQQERFDQPQGQEEGDFFNE